VNVLTTALAERGGKIKTVKIHQDGRTTLAPVLTPKMMAIDVAQTNGWIGTSLTERQMIECLRRMGYGASGRSGEIDVSVPGYRADIIHPVDLAEDVAIGYGFEKFGTVLPKRATFGEEVPLVAFENSTRAIMTGFGYFEVATISLSNPEEQYKSMGLHEERSVVRVKRPVSEEHVLVRTSLLPSILVILRKNKHRELPQKIFEVGDVVLDRRNKCLLTGASTHAKASFTEVKSLVQSILSSMGFDSEVSATTHPSFIPGRCALVSVATEIAGLFGEIAPAVIEAFELKYPVVAFELDLELLFRLHGSRSDSR